MGLRFLALAVLPALPAAAFWGAKKPEVPPGGMACDGGMTAVPAAHINDDYCDCGDGADEPRTSACSRATVGRSTFQCANVGWDATAVPASRVGDAACDCCDGSDEAAGACANTCEAEYNERHAAELAAAAAREAGRAARLGYVRDYEAGRAAADAEAGAKRAEADGLDLEIATRAAHLEGVEAEAAARRDAAAADGSRDAAAAVAAAIDGAGKDDVAAAALAVAAATAEVEALLDVFMHKAGLPDAVTNAIDDVDVLSLGVDAAEAVAAAAADDAAADARASADAALASLFDALHLGEADAAGATAVAAAVAAATTPTDDVAKRLATYDLAAKLAAAAAPAPVADLAAFAAPGYDEARAALQKLRDDAKAARDAAAEARKRYDFDAGPDGAFASLKDQCWSRKINQYTYEVCGWGKAKQDATRLGEWKEWRDDYATWHYAGGQYCSGHGARELTVSLKCGAEEHLGTVEEPTTCKYAVDLFTPAACRD